MVAVTDGDEIDLVPGPRNGERLPSYHRIDGRITREFQTRFGSLTAIGEIMNLTGAANVCCIDDHEAVMRSDGSIVVTGEEQHWPRVVPSLAVRWSF
jgi:hypothetical protein